MQEPKTWNMLLNHLSEKNSKEEEELFLTWFNKNDENKAFFNEVKTLWDDKSSLNTSFEQNISPTFWSRFSKQKMKDFVLKQAIGNFIGFMVGMWVTAMFSHNALEKKGLKNLFGLAKRKKIVVNEIPEWLQNGIAILIGFIVLELINHFFQSKKHLVVWEYIKKTYINIKQENKNTNN